MQTYRDNKHSYIVGHGELCKLCTLNIILRRIILPVYIGLSTSIHSIGLSWLLLNLTTARFLLLRMNIARIMIPKTIRIMTTTAMTTPAMRLPEESPDERSPTPPPTGLVGCEVVGADLDDVSNVASSVLSKS